MIRHVGGSHIPGRDKLQFQGYDKVRTPDAPSLNVTHDFTWGVQIQYVDLFPPLSYALHCKGEPEDPATGSIFIESVDGYLKVWIHDSDNVNSLVLLSDDPVLNTVQHKFIVVVRDYSESTVTVYINASPIQMNIVTGAGKHSTVAALGTINVVSDDIFFSYATGKSQFVGYYTYEVRDTVAWTPTQVYNKYQELVYTGSYTPLENLVSFRDVSGSAPYSMITSKENGQDAQIIGAFSSTSVSSINKSSDNTLIIFSDNSGSRVCNPDGSGVSHGNAADQTSDSVCISSNKANMVSASGGTRLTHFAIPLALSTSPLNVTGTGNHSSYGYGVGGNQVQSVSVQGTKVAYSITPSGSNYSLVVGDIVTSGVSISGGVLRLNVGSGRAISNIKISEDGNLVAFSMPITSGGNRAVYIIPYNGGNLSQLTDGSTHCDMCCFKPDSSEIIYSELYAGKYRLMRANLEYDSFTETYSITDPKNISNNLSNNIHAVWIP